MVLVGGCADESASSDGTSTGGSGGAGASNTTGQGGEGGADVSPPTSQFARVPADGQANGVASEFALTCSEADCTFECALDGASFSGCSVSPSFDRLAPGSHTLAVRATDAAGNLEPAPKEHTWSLEFGYRSVALTSNAACAVSGEGALYGWGSDANGEVGNGPGIASTARPTEIDSAKDWAKTYGGPNVLCAQKVTGELSCWGSGYPLGDATDTEIDSPTAFQPGGIEFSTVDIGYSFLCGLDASGGGHCIGEGYEGSLGDGDAAFHYAATPVSIGNAKYTSLSVGESHACAVTTSGALVCWGALPLTTPVASPTQIGSDTDWATVGAGSDHTCAIKSNGTLHCWGENSSGQLGVDDLNDRVAPTQVGSATDWVSVDADNYLTCVNNASAELFCFGDNGAGQIGSTDIANTDVSSPTRVQGALFHQVAASDGTTCGASDDGRVRCWGYNYEGLLGRGLTDVQSTLVSVDNQFDTITLSADQGGCGLIDDQAYCWGYGPVGQSDGLPRPTPVALSPAGQWTAIAAAQYGGHACGIRAGVVHCWGTNSFGELGNGSTVPASTPTPIAPITGSPAFVSLSVGRQSACAITAGHDLYCWGANVYGELGIGSTTPEHSPVKVGGTGWDQISLGHFRVAAHKTDGTFWNWGVNGSTTPSQLPDSDWVSVGATGFAECGIKASGTLHCTIQAIPGVFQAGTKTHWTKIIGPGYPYCALDNTGTMECFVSSGNNSFVASPALDTSAGWLDFEYPNSLCGLRAGNERHCRGPRHFGSLGDGFDERMPSPILAP